MTGITLVVLSYNSSRTLQHCLDSARGIVDSILVVDSHSTDDSVETARRKGARVLQRSFSNYADQRNWAAQQIEPGAGWILHLDSDEYLTEGLASEVARRVAHARPDVAGFMMRRRVRFMGREIRHGGLGSTWHLRLYRVGRGQCEDRLYDQHFVADGSVERLEGFFIDDNRSSLEVWTDRHNRWSTAEAQEYLGVIVRGPTVAPQLAGSPMNRKRWLKERFWNRLPLLWRAFAYFTYRYFFRLGFLDGREGLIFHALQGFWFRLLVDGKILEKRQGRESRFTPAGPRDAHGA